MLVLLQFNVDQIFSRLSFKYKAFQSVEIFMLPFTIPEIYVDFYIFVFLTVCDSSVMIFEELPLFKGTVSRDFSPSFFLIEQLYLGS